MSAPVTSSSTGERELASQMEHLQAKYAGTGHSDLTRHEWMVNQHRDSYASYLGHPNLLAYFSVAENLPQARLRASYLDKMASPCGNPPPPPAVPTATQPSSSQIGANPS